MQNKKVSRRTFVGSSAIGATVAAVGVPGVSKGFAANEKVRLAWLGVGGRGSHDLTVMANNNPDAQIVAVCELIEQRGRKGQKIVVQGSQVMLGGEGGEPVIKGQSFLSLFMTHIHPTGAGPSGPPVPQGEMSTLSMKVTTV